MNSFFEIKDASGSVTDKVGAESVRLSLDNDNNVTGIVSVNSVVTIESGGTVRLIKITDARVNSLIRMWDIA